MHSTKMMPGLQLRPSFFLPQAMVTGIIQAAGQVPESPTLPPPCCHLGLTWAKCLETYNGWVRHVILTPKFWVVPENEAWKGLRDFVQTQSGCSPRCILIFFTRWWHHLPYYCHYSYFHYWFTICHFYGQIFILIS